MKTRKVTITRAASSFSSAASHVSEVTLSREPWLDDEECDKATAIRDEVRLAPLDRVPG